MSSFFDSAAQHYDSAFTNTFTGRGQRNRVWKIFTSKLQRTSHSILELNCGTGEDALYLASLGHRILATDISPSMIDMARKKAGNISSLRFELADSNQLNFQEKFDDVFSNFGGLNCLSPLQLKSLNDRLGSLLHEHGLFVAVVMPRKCWWERLYFWYKKNPASRNRRLNKEAVTVQVESALVPTWFYTPKEFASYFPSFRVEEVKPIGIGFPPSYLNAAFEKNRLLRIFSSSVEFLFGNISSLSNYSDHFMIIFRKR